MIGKHNYRKQSYIIASVSAWVRMEIEAAKTIIKHIPLSYDVLTFKEEIYRFVYRLGGLTDYENMVVGKQSTSVKRPQRWEGK